MTIWHYSYTLLCHWCGKPFESKKPRGKARFCSARCKMAHHRAYKKYVTAKSSAGRIPRGSKVTQKKAKKG